MSASFAARFDAGEVAWDGDEVVVLDIQRTRTRLVKGASEIFPELAGEFAALNPGVQR